MKTKRFSRKPIAFLFAMAVFFCSVQSPSFAQVELVAESLTRLTEATLHNSTVILALGGAEFEDDVQHYLEVSGISGVSLDNVKLLDNTEIRVRLKFSGDFDQDATLTFTVRSGGIKNYNGRALTDEIPIPATVESLTATPASLTEATLNNSTVTLTLRGRTFESNIRPYSDILVSGISGVTVLFGNIQRLSNTEITVPLQFSGSFDSDRTLTFRVRSGSIKNYTGSELTAKVPVTAEKRIENRVVNQRSENIYVIYSTWKRRTEDFPEGYLTRGYYKIAPGEQRSFYTLPNNRIYFHISQFRKAIKPQSSTSTFPFWIHPTNAFRVVSPSPISSSVSKEALTYSSVARSELRQEDGFMEYSSGSQVRVTSAWVKVNVAASVSNTTVVRIPDPNLRAAIQQEIGNTLTTQTLLNLTSLDAYDLGITNLTGLEHATNLSVLSLDNNSISDVSPLTGLTRLTSLDLQKNSISDVSPLTGLTQLTSLYLYNNSISDVSPLTGLTQLTHLDLQKNNISDVSPLTGLTQLTSLYLYNNSISDVSPLTGLTQLTHLDLQKNSISDISPLVGLTRLIDLYLTENPLNDAALTTHIPAIQANGTEVEFDNRVPTTPQPTGVATTVYVPDDMDTGEMDTDEMDTTVIAPQPTGVATTSSHPPIYWVDLEASKIQYLDGSNVRDILTGLEVPWYIAVDIGGGKIYWTSAKWNDTKNRLDPGKIQCANLDGSNVQDIITGLDQIASLALDVAGGKLYWAMPDEGKIQCADLDGSNVRDLVTGLNRIFGLALDVAGGKMYWTAVNKIQYADLDGSNVRDLVTGLDVPSDIALDVAGGKMYWTHLDKIQRANLDGSNVQDIITGVGFPEDIALDVAGGKMYWTDLMVNKIQYASLDGSNVRDLVTAASPDDIALGIPPQTVVSRPTKTTQVLVDAADRPSMYWIDNDTLYRFTGANAQPIAERVNDVVIDTIGGKIYWIEGTSDRTGRIHSANVDGTGAVVVKELTSVPIGLALDSANGKLYLTNSWGKIQRMNVDGTQFETDLTVGLGNPMGIAVSSSSVYWTDANGNVRFASLKGPKVVRNIATGSGTLGGIAVGWNKVYWTAQTGNSSGEIRSANLNGTGVTVVATLTAVPHGITVDIREGYIYWTDDQGSVRRIRLNGTQRQNLVSNLVAPGAIAIGSETTADLMAATPATTFRAEDVNQDGRVDDVDLGMVAAALFGENPPANPGRLDVNGDGVLNIVDLTLVRTNIDEDDTMDGDDAMAMAAPALGIQRNALARDKIQAAIDLLLATDDGSLGMRRTLAYLQNLLAAVRPNETHLFANYPNPFNPETWIPYQLSTDSDVRITLYDMSGKVIRRLVLGYQSAGYYTSRSRAAYWDGRNVVGEPVASGLYFYMFTAGDFTATRRMLILK